MLTKIGKIVCFKVKLLKENLIVLRMYVVKLYLLAKFDKRFYRNLNFKMKIEGTAPYTYGIISYNNYIIMIIFTITFLTIVFLFYTKLGPQKMCLAS